MKSFDSSLCKSSCAFQRSFVSLKFFVLANIPSCCAGTRRVMRLILWHVATGLTGFFLALAGFLLSVISLIVSYFSPEPPVVMPRDTRTKRISSALTSVNSDSSATSSSEGPVTPTSEPVPLSTVPTHQDQDGMGKIPDEETPLPTVPSHEQIITMESTEENSHPPKCNPLCPLQSPRRRRPLRVDSCPAGPSKQTDSTSLTTISPSTSGGLQRHVTFTAGNVSEKPFRPALHRVTSKKEKKLAASASNTPTTPVRRTHPYEAPYFFPSPVSPEAEDYVRQTRIDRRVSAVGVASDSRDASPKSTRPLHSSADSSPARPEQVKEARRHSGSFFILPRRRRDLSHESPTRSRRSEELQRPMTMIGVDDMPSVIGTKPPKNSRFPRPLWKRLAGSR